MHIYIKQRLNNNYPKGCMIIECFSKYIMLSKLVKRASGDLSANVKCEMFHREDSLTA